MAERPVIVVELAADAQHARDLAAGGLFVPGCTLGLNADCDLIVRGAADELALHARVVFRDPQGGAGLELVGFGPELRERLAQLAAPAAGGGGDGGEADPDIAAWEAAWDALDPEAAEPVDDADAGVHGDDLALPGEPHDAARDHGAWHESADGGAPAPAAHGARGAAHPRAADPAADPYGAAPDPGPLDDAAARPSRHASRSVQERLRHLSLSQQIKRAHSGELQERITLERMYGKAVWEALLRNPRITAPEVARIARMGMLPRPLIELIVGNGGWLQIPEIRRALLANPRLQTDQILRVLRLLPKHELKLAAVQTAYPHGVRDAAKRMLRDLS